LPANERRLRIINLRDLEAEVQKVITPYGFAYVSEGAGDVFRAIALGASAVGALSRLRVSCCCFSGAFQARRDPRRG
jgi:hypothetical protein